MWRLYGSLAESVPLAQGAGRFRPDWSSHAAPMLTEDYRVRLDAFEGPLDLLLYLIRRAEVDVTDIPISTIADQYLAHLAGLEHIDIDVAGEFLVMAATLMEIKSRMLSPRRAGDAAGEGEQGGAEGGADTVAAALTEDPRAELVQQLLEFKRSRDAATALDRLRDEWARRFPTASLAHDRDALREAIAEQAADLDMEDLGLFDLVEAFERIARQVNFEALGAHHIGAEEDVPIEVHAEDILDQLRRGVGASDESGEAKRGETTFRALLTGRTRTEMIGLFLALLELIRRRAIRAAQDSPGGEILIRLCEETGGAAQAGAEASSPAT